MKRFGIIIAFVAVLGLPSAAQAFCGFYVAGGDTKLFNEATQVVLMRHNTTTVLSMQNSYEGPTENFAMVVPVPQVLQKENVKTLEKEVFDRVDKLGAPRLVEYWERDPCMQNLYGRQTGSAIGFGGLGLRGAGRGGGGKGFVKVEAEFKVGEYDIVILRTNASTALDGWLKTNNYNIPDGAEPFFRPYIEKGMYFFVAKVDAKKVKYEDDKAVLSPLRFHYESEEFNLPVRLGMINSKGKQDLIAHIIAPDQRYEVANYPNVTIPTNIEVGPAVRDQFGEFYEALFSRTVEENPKAVVTEYSWAATKCDPCPGGMIGGGGLTPADLTTLGNDVLNQNFGWNQPGWTLTRLHARYEPDDIGEDLVFQKANPIVGGREIRDPDGQLEKGANSSQTGNNFQGRYIIRNEWEGTVSCENPQHGIWGPPPNPAQMRIVAEVVVEELRRQKAAETGGAPTAEQLDAPWTEAEKRAVAYHMRKRFGTSQPPPSAGGSAPAVAPSLNTRGAGSSIGGGGLQLAGFVREPVPELNVTPEPRGVTKSGSKPVDEGASDSGGDVDAGTKKGTTAGGPPAVGSEDWPPGKPGCSTTNGGSGVVGILFALVAAGLRRRRD